MENPGEELVGSYLREVLECDFIEFNLRTRFVQGEIDVIGINTAKKTVYICEVATHLETGLLYVKESRPDNVERFVKKFEKEIEYTRKYLPEFEKVFMLWSPIVRTAKEGSQYNQMNDIDQIKNIAKERLQIDLKVIINEEYMKRIQALREIALVRKDEMKSPIMRFLQIEEKLRSHVSRLVQIGSNPE
jgi:Holliday junction resolvase-like predicted endonuclease